MPQSETGRLSLTARTEVPPLRAPRAAPAPGAEAHTETPAPSDHPPTPPADTDRMALSLVTLWAMRTGRTPPPAPYTALTAAELLGFWTDPDMDEPPATPGAETSETGETAETGGTVSSSGPSPGAAPDTRCR